nr:MAG TPA: hypothetical protein [Bacteriophage sp.]
MQDGLYKLKYCIFSYLPISGNFYISVLQSLHHLQKESFHGQ